MSQTALVTGANGFIGRYLLRSLSDSGHKVVGWRRAAAAHPQADAAITWRDVDVRDPAIVEREIAERPPDVIFHCAGMADPKEANLDPAAALKANALGTLTLLQSVRAHAPAARIVVASSAYVYPVSDEALDETTPCRPDSGYGHSKLGQEVVAKFFAESYGVRVMLARTFNGYGPGQSAGYVISDFTSKVASLEREGGGTLTTGNLDHIRDFLHIRDLVSAYETLAERGTAGEAYNVCSGEATPIRHLIDILKALSARPFEAVPSKKPDRRASDRRVLLGDSSKLKALGWSPRHSLHDGLAETLKSWRDAPR